MLIITGPTATGKNTIGILLAQQRERCAVVDFDLVRRMFVHPHRPPWAGEEGRAQQRLGVLHICAIAEGFAEAGWEVIILDVLCDETVAIYRSLLQRFNLRVVQLLPDFDVLRKRFYERGAVLTEDELRMVYKKQSEYEQYDLRIDNAGLEPQEVVEQIASLL